MFSVHTLVEEEKEEQTGEESYHTHEEASAQTTTATDALWIPVTLDKVDTSIFLLSVTLGFCNFLLHRCDMKN